MGRETGNARDVRMPSIVDVGLGERLPMRVDSDDRPNRSMASRGHCSGGPGGGGVKVWLEMVLSYTPTRYILYEHPKRGPSVS